MRFEFSGPPIVVPCTVEGPSGSSEPKLVLDTGAGITVLDAGFLRFLGFTPDKSKEICFLTTASVVVRAPIVIVAAISVLGVTKTDFPVAAHSLPPQANVSGLLGTDFLQDQILQEPMGRD